MIHLPASVRVYLCLNPCDMRRSFDGLHALVRDHLQLDAFAGHLYLFANKRRDRLKILYWDRDGFAIWAKRLEARHICHSLWRARRRSIRDHCRRTGSTAKWHRSEQRYTAKALSTRGQIRNE